MVCILRVMCLRNMSDALLHEMNESASPLDQASISSTTSNSSFVYVGRVLSHSAPISGISFGFKDGRDILISISEDR